MFSKKDSIKALSLRRQTLAHSINIEKIKWFNIKMNYFRPFQMFAFQIVTDCPRVVLTVWLLLRALIWIFEYSNNDNESWNLLEGTGILSPQVRPSLMDLHWQPQSQGNSKTSPASHIRITLPQIASPHTRYISKLHHWIAEAGAYLNRYDSEMLIIRGIEQSCRSDHTRTERPDIGKIDMWESYQQ